MRKTIGTLILSLLVLSFTGGLFANGLNLNGVGSKGSGMGTAFIGLADDWSAVFFNPAGLIQLKKPVFSAFVTDLIPTGTYKFEFLGTTLADTETKSLMYPSGALAYFKPVSDKMVAGIAAFVPSGVGARWPGDELAMLSGGQPFTWDSKIFMITVSPAVAIKFSDKLSFGAALNIDYAQLKMERPAGGEGGIPWFQYSENLDGIAVGATLGLMYKPNDIFQFGLSYKLPVKATIKGTSTAPFLTGMGLPGESEGKRAATWPMWAGAGIAVKPNDKLTIIADVIWYNWGKLQDIPVTYASEGWKAAGLEEGGELVLNWEDTVNIKFGIEYRLSDSFALRAGYYTDHSPSDEETLNILLPSIDYRGWTMGFGYKRGKIQVDVAFEYLSGDDRYVDPMNYYAGSGMPGTHGMKILVPNITFTYTFD